jgi:hypothetical protein
VSAVALVVETEAEEAVAAAAASGEVDGVVTADGVPELPEPEPEAEEVEGPDED